MGLESRPLLGHCSPQPIGSSGHLQNGSTDHFEGTSASRMRGQARSGMAQIDYRSPHEGACDIDAERASEDSGSQQSNGGPYDHRAGSDFDGSEQAPHQAYSGGIQKGRRSRNCSRQSRSQTGQCHTGDGGCRCGGPGTHAIRGSQSHAPDELLRERESIDIGRNTLRKILTDAGVNSPRRRRPPKHRVRRQRMAREGMLIQLDGSYHRWLGEDGPQFTLLLAFDDATGCVVNALFCEYENTRDYLLLMRDLIQSHGIPLALNSDRHGVFKHTPPSENASAPTQFARAMGELGVQLILARSPQAKGRVERTAGTLQDRLVTELRLARATTIDDANRVLYDFLPRFNERFGVPSQHAETAYRVQDPGDVPGHCPMSEVQAQGWQGQHGEVPLAHPTAASR